MDGSKLEFSKILFKKFNTQILELIEKYQRKK